MLTNPVVETNPKAIDFAKFLGDRAMIDAKVYNQPIVYLEGENIVIEYPNGRKEIKKLVEEL